MTRLINYDLLIDRSSSSAAGIVSCFFPLGFSLPFPGRTAFNPETLITGTRYKYNNESNGATGSVID